MVRCPRCQRRLPPNGECAFHGHPSTVVEVVEAAEELGSAPPGWKLGRFLANGGTAQVHLVERGTGSSAILKRGRYRERDVHARFELEAEILRAVGPPTTPQYIEHGRLDDHPYLIMEHVAGETLAAWMGRTGERGGLGEILAILTRIAAGLAALHRAGYVHRDFKPENVLVGPKGARLLDFGLAKPLAGRPSDLTQIGVVVGTVHYLAPEQIRMGAAVDHRADLYSFGVVAFEMLTGRPPFVGERRALEYQHQVVRPPAIRETRAIPDELEELVQACLAKQVEHRPATADELGGHLSRAFASIGTLRGVGGGRAVTPSAPPPNKSIGAQTQIVLALIEGGDPVAVTRAVAATQGLVVRQHGDTILAAYTQDQTAPVVAALEAFRPLVRDRCRVVVHHTTALVRRSAAGKQTVYGADVERPETWRPSTPFGGLLLTASAARQVAASPADIPGFYRETRREQSDAADTRGVPRLVGRDNLVRSVVAALTSHPAALVGISGGPGAGKSRVLDAVLDRLRTSGRDVVFLRGRRRLLGDRPDDERVIEALASRALIVVDDAHHFSPAAARALIDDNRHARLVASVEPIFEVAPDAVARTAFELPALTYADASALLREQLQPAHLLPDVLIERLAIRGAGNPSLLVALARDIKRRGAIRRHAGGDDWYVAADELDTLLAPPGPSWLALRAIEDLPPELVPIVRACVALGPRFNAEEVAATTGVADVQPLLALLVQQRMFTERNGWYEFEDAAIQEALYDLVEERDLVHHRALAYWQQHRGMNVVGWLARLAYHAAGAREANTAAASWIALARQARRRGEDDHADELLARAVRVLAATVPALAGALSSLEDAETKPT